MAKSKRKEEAEKDEEEIPNVGGIWKFIRHFTTASDRVVYVIGVIFAIAAGTGMPAFSYMFSDIIDSLNETDPNSLVDGVNKAALFGIIAGSIELCLYWIFTYCFSRQGETLLTRARQRVFEAVTLQELGWFEKHKPGTVSSYLTSDLLKTKEAMGEHLGMFIANLATYILSFAYGFWVSWRLTLILCALQPFLLLSGVLTHAVLARLTSQGDKAYGKANDVATEVLASIRTITAFNGFKLSRERYTNALGASTKASMKKAYIQGLSFGFTWLIIFVSYAIAFYYGSWLVQWKINTGGEVVGTFLCVLIGSFMFGSSLPHTGTMSEFKAVTNRIFFTVERVPPIQLSQPNAPTFPVVGRIEFRDIKFRYPSRPEQLIFKRLNLTVEPGTKLALVGNSGSGKSSLLSLVERMYDPEEGDIYVDGHRLRDLDLTWWRDHVGIVMQEPVLFQGTIRENIRMGSRAPVTDEQIIEACKMANIHDTIIGLPDQYETQVGDGGGQLSGGQRQRICIARAIVKNPRILLLDEATSALDRQSEMVVQQALDAAMAGRTTLIVAHRLVTIRNADNICFIKPPQRPTTQADLQSKGEPISTFDLEIASPSHSNEHGFSSLQPYRPQPVLEDTATLGWSTIAEMGSHDQLMANGGPYSLMVTAQAAVEQSNDSHGGNDDQELAGFTTGQRNHVIAPPTTPIGDGTLNKLDVFNAPTPFYGGNAQYGDLPRPGPSSPNGPFTSHQPGVGMVDDVSLNVSNSYAANGVGQESSKKKKKNKKSKKDKEEDDDVDMSKASLTRVAKMNSPEWAWLVLGMVGAIVGAFVYPVYAILLTRMTETFFKSTQDMRDEVPLWCGAFAIIGVVSGTAICVRTVGFGVAGARLTERIRIMLYISFLKQDVGFFDLKKNDPGALANVLSGDTSKVHMLFGPTFGLHVQNLLTLIVGLVVAFVHSWKLTFVILAAVPLMAIAGALNMAMMGGMDKSGGLYDQANQVVVETVAGIKTIMAINLQAFQVGRYTGYMNKVLAQNQRKAVVSGFFAGVTQFIFFATFALAFWFGGTRIKAGDSEFGDVMTAAMAILMSAMGMGETNAQAGLASDAKQATARVFHYIDRVPPIDMDAPGHVFNNPRGALTFEDVVFSYPSRPDTTVLRRVNLDVEPGTSLALIGSTGCGKSTIIQLLERFYDPAAGRVLVDGVPIKDLQLQAWRENIGLVGQEPMLFDDTVEYNIKFGKPNATDEEMIEAARIAQIHEIVERLPEGYKTRVGLKGAGLSGGQRQRLAIARAIIKRPALLLLDEATAALDNVSEVEVQRALDNVIQTLGMTVVTVAHRLSTIANVDKIAVLHRGIVVEHGSHNELYALGGEYKARYDAYHGTGGGVV